MKKKRAKKLTRKERLSGLVPPRWRGEYAKLIAEHDRVIKKATKLVTDFLKRSKR